MFSYSVKFVVYVPHQHTVVPFITHKAPNQLRGYVLGYGIRLIYSALIYIALYLFLDPTYGDIWDYITRWWCDTTPIVNGPMCSKSTSHLVLTQTVQTVRLWSRLYEFISPNSLQVQHVLLLQDRLADEIADEMILLFGGH